MHYSFLSITGFITIAITSITCIAASIPSPSPCQSTSPSRLSHPLQSLSYNNIHHFHNHGHHVYPMHYSLYLLTMSNTSITIAITSNTWITASIVKQCLSPSPSRLSHALQPQSNNNVLHFHQHRHHVYHIHKNLNATTMSITIAFLSKICITASILLQSPSLPSPSRSRLSHPLQLQSYNNVHYHRH